MPTTLDAIKADNGVRLQFCITIEGLPWIITDGPAAAAVTAYSGTGYSSALEGLIIKWADAREMVPWDKDLSVQLMSFGVIPDDADTFGKAIFASAGGTETKLTVALDLNDTTANVVSTSAFASSGEIHIGTERMTYSGKTATTFTGLTRGTYAPLEMDTGNLPRVHSLTDYSDLVTLRPTVSSQLRSMDGRWVAVYAHRVVAGVLDTRAEAHLVFLGKVVGVSDDELGRSWVNCEDVLGTVRDCMLLSDQFVADVKDGVYLAAGAVFDCGDFYTGGTQKNANALTVVASGAVAPNEIDAGIYSHSEICSFLNRWLAAENTAGRLNSRITFGLVQTDQGYRTQVQIFRSGASAISVKMLMPNDAWKFLGWGWANWQPFDVVGSSGETLSANEPYRRMMTIGQVPGDGSIVFETEREVGEWFDNRQWLPSDFGNLDAGESWAVLQVQDAGLILAKRTASGFALTASEYSIASLRDISGRETSDDIAMTVKMGEGGPLTVKQVAIFQGPFNEMVMRFLASTGTANYNGDYDVLPAQLGAAIPAGALGLEQDLNALQVGDADQLFVIDKPYKLWERLQGDFMSRAAMLVVKNGLVRCSVWSTPTATTALHDLTEDNKAEPFGTESPQRTVTSEDSSFVVNIVKLEYNRSLSDGKYRSSITIKDKEALEATGTERPITIQLPNLFGGAAGGVAVVEALAGYIAGWMPLFSKPLRILRRSVNQTLYEDIAPGDQANISDLFVRDTVTGARGITGKPGLIIRHQRSYGGPTDGNGDPLLGEVDLLVYPRDRIAPYCPTADVDETAANGGWDSANKILTIKWNEYTKTGTALDIDHFAAGDKVIVHEVDPVLPGSPLSWTNTILQTDPENAVYLTDAMVGWDATKRYRMISQPYADAAAQQKAKVYQADGADGLIQDVAQAYEYGWQASNITNWEDEDPGSVQVALYSTLAYGDGYPLDTGYERDIARLVNNLISYRTAPSQPYVFSNALTASVGVVRTIVMILPIQLGEGDLLAGDRYLYVSPEYASKGGSTTIRISLCRGFPIGLSRTITDADAPAYVLVGPSETATFTTSSTTLAIGSAHAFSAKSLDSRGEGWLVVEVDPNSSFLGLAECRWGPYSRTA